jgi:HK97 family phage major capsid protein
VTTLTDLLRRAESDVSAAQAADARARDELVSLRVQLEQHKNVPDAVVNDAIARRDATQAALAAAQSKLTELQAVQRDEDEQQRLSTLITPISTAREGSTVTSTKYDQVHRIGHEAGTYRPDSEHGYLRDLFRAQVLHDPASAGRLERYGREVEVDRPGVHERAVNSGGAGSFVPPSYLVAGWAELARAGRPFAGVCNTSVPLPAEGMTVNVPRITTGSTTAAQTAENATISNQDLDETTLAVPVVTVAGYVDVSRQALDRGATFEQVIFADLSADYAAKLDAQLISGTGANGQHLGVLGVGSINAVTYTDASPTVAEAWPKIADAVQQVASARYAGPSAIVMHPRRWGWFLSATDTTGRPFVVPNGNGPSNAAGVAEGEGYGSVGTLMGLPVATDANVPTNLGGGTNEDRIIVVQGAELLLMEEGDGAPLQLRFDDVLSSSLGVRLVAFGYSAFASGRQPKAISVISGSGVITPTF